MTPELMEAGSRRLEALRERQAKQAAVGGRVAARAQLLRQQEPDFTQGVALYLDDTAKGANA